MAVNTREELLTAFGTAKRRFRLVALPVSGVTVRIRSLTEGELSAYQRRLFAKGGRGLDPTAMQSANRRLFVLCIVDGDGNRLFTNDDENRFADMDAADASKLYEECAEHCGIDRTDLGDTSKNSEATAGDSAPSD